MRQHLKVSIFLDMCKLINTFNISTFNTFLTLYFWPFQKIYLPFGCQVKGIDTPTKFNHLKAEQQ